MRVVPRFLLPAPWLLDGRQRRQGLGDARLAFLRRGLAIAAQQGSHPHEPLPHPERGPGVLSLPRPLRRIGRQALARNGAIGPAGALLEAQWTRQFARDLAHRVRPLGCAHDH